MYSLTLHMNTPVSRYRKFPAPRRLQGSQYHPATGNHYSNFYHHRLVLPICKLHMKRTTWHEFLCVCILSLSIVSHSPMCAAAVCSFSLLCRMAGYEYTASWHTLFVACKHSFLFAVYPGVELLGHLIHLMFIFERTNRFKEFWGCPCYVAARYRCKCFTFDLF